MFSIKKLIYGFKLILTKGVVRDSAIHLIAKHIRDGENERQAFKKKVQPIIGKKLVSIWGWMS